MALSDFTGQNIKDTYQRVVQTKNGAFADGTGSAIYVITADQTASFALSGSISGAFAETSASFSVRVTNLKSDSGSFSTRVSSLENSSTLNGEFTHVTASGNISASGVIVAKSGSFTNMTADIVEVDEQLFIGDLAFEEAIVSLKTGSNQFGGEHDDLHGFTGSISISGSNGLSLINGTLSIPGFSDVSASLANDAGQGFPFSGSAIITGSLILSASTNVDKVELYTDVFPGDDDEFNLGSFDKKWNSIFATNTFFGGIHEVNLETKGLDQLRQGTVLVLKAGKMVPCELEADPLVTAVVSTGSNFPIILGAEPILVHGPVYEGDYIITSNIKGHGKGVSPYHIYDKQLFGKIIAQSLETNLNGGVIKAMIRKM